MIIQSDFLLIKYLHYFQGKFYQFISIKNNSKHNLLIKELLNMVYSVDDPKEYFKSHVKKIF